MAIADARTQAYIAVFRNQHGVGGISVFQGTERYQSGQGIGDFFRGIFRRIIPVALNVGKAALSAFSGAQDQGASFQDSLKAVIRPATQAVARGAMEQIEKVQQERAEKEQREQAEKALGVAPQPEQKGQGRRRRKYGSVYKPEKYKRRKTVNYNF